METRGNTIVDADAGTDAPGVTPYGGTGKRGWLSSIYHALSYGTLTVQGPVAAGQPAGNPQLSGYIDGSGNVQSMTGDFGGAVYVNQKTLNLADDTIGAAAVDPIVVSSAPTGGTGSLTLNIQTPSLVPATQAGSNPNAAAVWSGRVVELFADNNASGQTITSAVLTATYTVGTHTYTVTAQSLLPVQPTIANNALGRYLFAFPVGVLPTSLTLTLTFAGTETAGKQITVACIFRNRLAGHALSRTAAAGITNPVTVKAGPGGVYGFSLYNPNTSTVYAHFFDQSAASVTLGTTTPILTKPIYGGGIWDYQPGDTPLFFCGVAIVLACTTSWAGGTTPASGIQGDVAYV